MNELKIRQEDINDHSQVEKLVEAAFIHELDSDHTEHLLVGRLRKSDAFVPQLSLVAVIDGQIVGYILFTKVFIGSERHPSLALAPVAVLPEYQGIGIGGKLIDVGHRIARKLGFGSVIVLGHEDYYPLFGYKQLSDYDIQLPFEDVPSENCMAVELVPDALKNVTGMVEYAKEFFE